MDKKPRTTAELRDLANQPGMNFPEALEQTSLITDINLEIIEVLDVISGVGKKGYRGVMVKICCHNPPTIEEKNIEYVRKRVSRKSPICAVCYAKSPRAKEVRLAANRKGTEIKKEMDRIRAEIKSRRRKKYGVYRPLTDHQWKEKLLLWDRLV